MPRGLNKHDTFNLIAYENIDNNDYQIIFMLYQPLIGNLATTLYLTLWQEKELTKRINLEFTHDRLMKILNTNEIDLLKAFKTLEFYQLILTYYHPLKSVYIYDLKKPVTTDLFFEDHKLSSKLKIQLGTLHYERQRFYFLKNEVSITDEFIDVSEKKLEDLNLTNNYNIQDTNINSSLNEIFHNLNIKAKFSAFNHKQISNYQQPVSANLETNTKIIAVQKNSNLISIFDQKITAMKTKNPFDYIIDLTKKPITSKIKNILLLLNQKLQLNNEVINCLIEYVSFKNEKRLEANYIWKIAKTFSENNIDNVDDALKHLKTAYWKSKKNNFSNNYHQDILWTNDGLNFQENDNQTTTSMSKAEIEKILKEFDEQ